MKRYNKFVRWAAREIFKALAEHIDEHGNLDPKVGWEIKVYAERWK